MGILLKAVVRASKGSEGLGRVRRLGPRRAGVREETDAKTTTLVMKRRAGGFRRLLVVMAGLLLVHGSGLAPEARAGDKAGAGGAGASGAGASGKAAQAERAFYGALPPAVVEMREQILAAVHSGAIGDLIDAIEWNEIKPDFGAAGSDPIAYWKRVSADGEGREVLSDLANMLALPPARLALGRDPENTMVYVWPYLAELPLDALKPGEEVDLLRLVPAEKARQMRVAKKWTWWRLAIGADGTWHTFRTYE